MKVNERQKCRVTTPLRTIAPLPPQSEISIRLDTVGIDKRKKAKGNIIQHREI